MSFSDKPVVVFSSCLLGEKVRYDGSSSEDQFALKLKDFVYPVKVCPEIEIGLGVPRKKIFLLKINGCRVIQEETKADFTSDLNRFSKNFLKSLKTVDGFFLKSKSPSCGVSGAKTYKNPDRTGYIGRKTGLFALNVKKYFPYYPVEDEIRLKDFHRRYYFLTRLYILFYGRSRGFDFVLKNYPHILKLFNKSRFADFEKNPDKKNLLKIFSLPFTQKVAEKKVKNFREKILNDPDFRKSYVIFPYQLIG